MNTVEVIVVENIVEVTTPGPQGASGGGGGTSNHALLTNLDYANANHTGFAGTGVVNTFTANQTVTGTLTATALVGDGSGLTNLDAGDISAGTLPVVRGGTGQTTASAAINALVPSQTGNNGKVLQTNGTAVSWQDVTAEGLDHAQLENLDYSNAGHTGFAGTDVSNTFTADQTIAVSGDNATLTIDAGGGDVATLALSSGASVGATLSYSGGGGVTTLDGQGGAINVTGSTTIAGDLGVTGDGFVGDGTGSPTLYLDAADAATGTIVYRSDTSPRASITYDADSETLTISHASTGTTSVSAAGTSVVTTSAAAVGLTVQGAASQSTDVLRVINSAGQVLCQVGAGGTLTVTPRSPSSGDTNAVVIGNTSSQNPVIKWTTVGDLTGMKFVSGSTEVFRIQDNGFILCGSGIQTANGFVIFEYGVRRGGGDGFCQFDSLGSPAVRLGSNVNNSGYTCGVRAESPHASVPAFISQGYASQTADLIRATDSSAAVQFAVGAGGEIKTNQTSGVTSEGTMTHRMPVYDASGTLVGYVPIYDSL